MIPTTFNNDSFTARRVRGQRGLGTVSNKVITARGSGDFLDQWTIDRARHRIVIRYQVVEILRDGAEMQRVLNRRKGSQRILRHDQKSSPQIIQTKQKSQKGLRTHESTSEDSLSRRPQINKKTKRMIGLG
jgi:hypothetical protein